MAAASIGMASMEPDGTLVLHCGPRAQASVMPYSGTPKTTHTIRSF